MLFYKIKIAKYHWSLETGKNYQKKKRKEKSKSTELLENCSNFYGNVVVAFGLALQLIFSSFWRTRLELSTSQNCLNKE